jgi:NadR type nicotinamide-nucleotide adenylyltransferase
MYKIAVIGPESTGKSNLSEYLANHYNCLWVPEFAREYCAKLNRECDMQDELNIFFGQLNSERTIYKESLKANHKLLICDTTIVTVKVWTEHVFKTCPDFVEREFKQRHYDLYLLTNNDLPWQDDPLRNFPNEREFFYEWYLKLLQENNLNFRIITGVNEDRNQNAVKAVDQFINQNQ